MSQNVDGHLLHRYFEKLKIKEARLLSTPHKQVRKIGSELFEATAHHNHFVATVATNCVQSRIVLDHRTSSSESVSEGGLVLLDAGNRYNYKS